MNPRPSRGLRELPEYKAVKAAKRPPQADEQIPPALQEIQGHGTNWTNARCSKKRCSPFSKQIQENAFLSDFC